MERRIDQRIALNVHLTCRVPAMPRPAVMHDLSHLGCRLEFREADVELGGTTVLEVPGVTQIPGRVMWVRGNEAGIQFHRRLTETAAVVLGLDEPPPVEAEPLVADDEPNLRGLLQHWIRRLTGAFRN